MKINEHLLNIKGIYESAVIGNIYPLHDIKKISNQIKEIEKQLKRRKNLCDKK